MFRSRVLTGVAFAATAALTALVVVLVVWQRDDAAGEAPRTTGLPTVPAASRQPPPSDSEPSARPSAITARAVIAPRIVLFGDTVRARVDVVLDRSRVDPESVQVVAPFSPWEIVAGPERVKRDAGSMTYLRTTYVLRCLSSPCLPPGQTMQLEFDPVRVTFARLPSGQSRVTRNTLRLDWPVLAVYSRFASASFEGRAALATPWRAELVSFPAASHRAPPGLMLALLLGGGAMFALVGAVLVYLAWPRRVPVPPVEPEAPPLPRLTPLQQALALLEDAARPDGAEGRRRSLELVAEVLAEWGDDDLARSARVLAWSEHEPAIEETTGLAARVRETLEEEEAAAEAAAEGNGRVG
jgi:hypothetical protein